MVTGRIRQADGYLQYKIIVLWWHTPSVQLPLTKIPRVQIEVYTLDDSKLSKSKETIFCKEILCYPSAFPTFLHLIHSPSQRLPAFLNKAVSYLGSHPTETL